MLVGYSGLEETSMEQFAQLVDPHSTPTTHDRGISIKTSKITFAILSTFYPTRIDSLNFLTWYHLKLNKCHKVWP